MVDKSNVRKSKEIIKKTRYITGVIFAFIIAWATVFVGVSIDVDFQVFHFLLAYFFIIICFISFYKKSIKLGIKTFSNLKDGNDGSLKKIDMIFVFSMLGISLLVGIFSLIWIIFIVKDALLSFGKLSGFDVWKESLFWASSSYILGQSNFYAPSLAPFIFLLISFILIILWAIIDVRYEWFKKKTMFDSDKIQQNVFHQPTWSSEQNQSTNLDSDQDSQSNANT